MKIREFDLGQYPPQNTNIAWISTEDYKLKVFVNGEWRNINDNCVEQQPKEEEPKVDYSDNKLEKIVITVSGTVVDDVFSPADGEISFNDVLSHVSNGGIVYLSYSEGSFDMVTTVSYLAISTNNVAWPAPVVNEDTNKDE